MKTYRIVTVLIICLGLLFSTTSCLVQVKENNGRHKGWHKNSNNPHHPNSTNPGNRNHDKKRR